MSIRFAALSGLRAGELAALRSEELDTRGGRVHVVSSLSWVAGHGFVTKEPKNRQRRWVPVPRSVVVEVNEMALRVGGEYVWQSPDGGPLDHNNFYKRHLKPAVRLADVPDRTRFHDLRHTCAALLTASGADLLTVSRRLGHSSTAVTDRIYGHLFAHRKDELSQRLDDMMRAASLRR